MSSHKPYLRMRRWGLEARGPRLGSHILTFETRCLNAPDIFSFLFFLRIAAILDVHRNAEMQISLWEKIKEAGG